MINNILISTSNKYVSHGCIQRNGYSKMRQPCYKFTPVADCGTTTMTSPWSKKHFSHTLPLQKRHCKTIDRTLQTAGKANYYYYSHVQLATKKKNNLKRLFYYNLLQFEPEGTIRLDFGETLK